MRCGGAGWKAEAGRRTLMGRERNRQSRELNLKNYAGELKQSHGNTGQRKVEKAAETGV